MSDPEFIGPSDVKGVRALVGRRVRLPAHLSAAEYHPVGVVRSFRYGKNGTSDYITVEPDNAHGMRVKVFRMDWLYTELLGHVS